MAELIYIDSIDQCGPENLLKLYLKFFFNKEE